MEYKGLKLDRFQEEAIDSIDKNHSVVVSAPTGSGKTLIADYIINKYIKKDIRVIYTAPIKALSNQKYKEFSKDFGEKNVGLLTGDIVRNPGAPILIMTTEIYRNMALVDDPMINEVSYVVFDEIHFINDIERGYVWEESIIFSKPHVRFLCLSATIPNASEFADWIQSIKKHNVDVIKQDKRNVPLHMNFYDTEQGITTLEHIRDVNDSQQYARRSKNTAIKKQFIDPPSPVELISEIEDQLPCFFFNFSRKSCQDDAVELAQAKIFNTNPEIASFIRKKLSHSPPEINNLKSTKILRQTLPYGIGFHHAGLIPIMKELVEELFSKGLIKVLYTTETFAVGINMPAKTVCFRGLRKFDGVSFRFLNSKEYFQIAGRAGRRGIDKEGFVYAMIERRDFNYDMLKKLTTSDTDPIRSQFRLSVNTVLNLVKRHTDKEIDKILCKNFHSFQKYGPKLYTKKKGVVYRNFNNIIKKLCKMGYIEDNKITEKGEFSSRIYADEILSGEIFATGFHNTLDDFQTLMILACLCYEPRPRTELYQKYPSSSLNNLRKKLRSNFYLSNEQKFRSLKDLTALIQPCYDGESIFEIIKNTNLLEGDVIRFFRQILDRIGQISSATTDKKLIHTLGKCQYIIDKSMKDIDVI